MVWPARFAVFLFLVSIPAAAQDLSTKVETPDNGASAAPASSAVESSAPTSAISPSAAPESAEAIKNVLPDKPAPRGNFVTRPFYDKQIRLFAEINGGAALWDDVASRLVIERGGYERNPFMRPFVHNTGTLAVESVAEVWAMAYVGNWMKHSSHPILRKTWWLPQSLNITAKLTGGIWNSVLLSR